MDLGTLIGLVAGLGVIGWAMMLGGGIMPFVDGPSVIIVFGGTIAACFTNQKVPYVVSGLRCAVQAFVDQSTPRTAMIPLVVRLANKARKEGLVALEGEPIDDPFLARGVRLGVDGLSPEVIKEALSGELAAIRERHDRGQKLFRFMASTAPAMGLIGTIIGLVQMLENLSDPQAIGPAMAIALLTTLYGALIAFVICGPIAEKLAHRTAEEAVVKKMAITGVESILKGDNTMVIESKLMAYLSPQERESLVSE
ncbi:MotA/TolQ/ExbB proton channel family protein [Myxococcota bacterium]|nr:MotA/TolQ/ExbB proton channel family protein [Myxococcota bacterium]